VSPRNSSRCEINIAQSTETPADQAESRPPTSVGAG
jgi:hypothetical protein